MLASTVLADHLGLTFLTSVAAPAVVPGIGQWVMNTAHLTTAP